MSARTSDVVGRLRVPGKTNKGPRGGYRYAVDNGFLTKVRGRCSWALEVTLRHD